MNSTTRESIVRAPARGAVLDVTEELERAIKDSGVTNGCAVAYCQHTTCGLLINEWEDGVLEDFIAHLVRLIPQTGYFAHDDLGRRTQNLQLNERVNGWSHVAQMLFGATSHSIPAAGREPLLGRWQRLIFVELDEPQDRTLLFHVFGN